ncbi:MAG: DUF2268 domain-containing putative Zn-dependent protease [Pseudomonadota bacterium]
MSVQIAFSNGFGLLAPEVEAEIRAGIDEGIAALEAHVPVAPIAIAVHQHANTSRFTGTGGRSYGPDSCVMWVDDANPVLGSDTRRKLARLTVHEVHHCLRQRHFWPRRWQEWAGGEVLVLEGLATQCEAWLGYGEPLIVTGHDSARTRDLLDRLAPDIAATPPEDGNPVWQWLYELNGYPEQVYRAVYPMGHLLVGRYLERTEHTPISALSVPWREIWETGRM